ncbi:unnamed protein product [Protopolystoma xenopodis]|uniref:Uncharacterized protein n=1 Tax=Protopolystoma xenopodis TaxID=117903 RepID=A0A448WTB8_9PLAT|nr:unnamed protein product [Protopolystoma xenopodis]
MTYRSTESRHGSSRQAVHLHGSSRVGPSFASAIRYPFSLHICSRKSPKYHFDPQTSVTSDASIRQSRRPLVAQMMPVLLAD